MGTFRFHDFSFKDAETREAIQKIESQTLNQKSTKIPRAHKSRPFHVIAKKPSNPLLFGKPYPSLIPLLLNYRKMVWG